MTVLARFVALIKQRKLGMEEKLLDVESAARTLSISKWTLRALVRAGKLTPVRIGRRLLLEIAEIDRFIAESKAPVNPSPTGTAN